MATLNKRGLKTAKPYVRTPVTTVAQDTVTFEGAAAWSRDAKSDLFLLGVSNFYGEDTAYERVDPRNKRFVELVHRVTTEDPEWIMGFLPWLRRQANIRTASVVGAIEAARVLARPDQPGSEMGPARRIINETLLRADEPDEAMSYWLSNYGRRMPGPIRRGIGDVARRLYTERNVLKYDSDRQPVRMADVIALTHPSPNKDTLGQWDQGLLFRYLLDSRHRPTDPPVGLSMIRARKSLLEELRGPDRDELLRGEDVARALNEGGMTWEALSSTGPMNKAAWEAIIPNLGYMALLRNLRNFSKVEISPEMKALVAGRLMDSDEVARSRQLPYRFLTAWLEATAADWALPLERALELSTQNIPALPGRTLVLVDTSGSMTAPMSSKSKITRMMAGATLGIALAMKGENVDLHGYANGTFKHVIRRGGGLMRTLESFVLRSGEVGHGTQTAYALRSTWDGHDRVVIVTDCQTFGTYGDVSDQIPSSIPIYAFNTAGFAPAMMETSKTRHELGGLTDHTFKMIPLIESGMKVGWPWEETQ